MWIRNCVVFIYLTYLIVFSIIPAPTVFCWDTLFPTEFEARITLTSCLTASTGASYIQTGAHLGTAISTRVIVAVLTALNGWGDPRKRQEKVHDLYCYQLLFATVRSILKRRKKTKAGFNNATYGRLWSSSTWVLQCQLYCRYQYRPVASHIARLGHHE